MADKQLKSMDKMQLLNIMLTQENEISRLNAAIQSISAEKNNLAMSLEETRSREYAVSSDHQNEIDRLNAALRTVAAEKESLAESLEEARALVYSAPAPAVTIDSEEIDRLNAVIADLNAEIRTTAREKEELEKNLKERPARDSADPFDKASQSVNEIMRSAQDSADLYLKNIKRLESEKVTIVRKIEDEANEKAAEALKDADEKAAEIIRAAEYKRREIENESQATVEDLRAVSRRYIDFVDSAHTYMHEMIENYRLLDTKTDEAENELYDQIQKLRTGDKG